ncbi:MAG: immunoglobulin domain-containing protein, partial [Candidatus Kapaibacterium sp.]
MKRILRFFAVIMLVAMVMSTSPVRTFAYSGGITGRTVIGCSCHNGTSTNTNISFTGPMTVNAGSSNSLTLVVANSSRPRAGFNMDFVNASNNQISGLAVVSGQGASMSGNEMTHSSAKTINSGQATWQFTLNAPTTPGLYTIRVAGNATQNSSTGDARTSTQTIIVKGVTLTGPVGGSAYCTGGILPVQWTSYGVSNVNIQLSSDGGATYSTVASPTSNNGTNTFNYTIPTSTAAGTTYRVRVVDAADASLVSAMTSDFTISSGLSIVTQPSPPTRTACQGSTVTYSVVASGASLSYQWRKDGNNLSGASSAILTLTNVQTGQAGSYDCVVSSSCGTPATTVPVTLAIDPSTSITTHPAAVNVCEGSPINLSVVALGSALQYQWKKGGTDIPGATRSTLNIPMAATADAGSYVCTVTGTCGTPVNSNAAAVSVSSTPVFSTQPKDASQCEGTAATMAASVVNASGLSFEWLKDGVVVNASARVTGVNTQTLNIASLQASDAGTYQLRAFSPVCSSTVSSSSAILGVRTKPLITGQPQSRSAGV